MRNLTNSEIQRRNILNNIPAIQKVQKYLDLGGSKWKGRLVFTKLQVANIFDVSERTVERYISSHGNELKENGYKIIKGKDLSELKKFVRQNQRADIGVGSLINALSLFTFKSVLNLAMLLTESEKAKIIRTKILDIVIDFVNSRTGGNTKYINQRDPDYLMSAFQEDNYRKNFTDALNKYLEEKGQRKFGKYTNLIYKSIFKENAQEYRKILKLEQKDKIRDTMYSEVLDLIASYEIGVAKELKDKFEEIGRKLTEEETDKLFKSFESHPLFIPFIKKARTKMASRDLHFCSALHNKLEEYITSIPKGDFEKFLGEKSKSLAKQIEETRDVFERLKNK